MRHGCSMDNQASTEQVFLALRAYFLDTLGITEEFQPQDRIDEVLKRAELWAEVDLADVALGLDGIFGLGHSPAEWGRFLGTGCTSVEEWERTAAPHFTFGDLAAFIASQLGASVRWQWRCRTCG